MFGNKALKEELEFQRKQTLRLEGEKWELARDNTQLEREKDNYKDRLFECEHKVIALENKLDTLERTLEDVERDRRTLNEKLVMLKNKKVTKDELIAQLAELLLDENRSGERESLITQMNAALRINNQPVPPMQVQQGVVHP